MGRSKKKSLKPKLAQPIKPLKKVKKKRAARDSRRNSSKREEKKPLEKITSENANHVEAGKYWSDSEKTLLKLFSTDDGVYDKIRIKLIQILDAKNPDLKELKIYADLLGESSDRLKEIIAEAKKYGFWGTQEENTEKILNQERLKLFAKRNVQLESSDPIS